VKRTEILMIPGASEDSPEDADAPQGADA
jgi:hypothetical protein